MKILHFILVISLLNEVFQSCPLVKYSYETLVLTWPGQFCHSMKCPSSYYRSWNGRKFTVHGLWPQSSQTGFLSCVLGRDADPHCNSANKFNASTLSSSLAQSLLTRVWPDMKGGANPTSFLEYEYNKHGVCYEKLLRDRHTIQKSAQIQTGYFNSVVAKYNQITKNFRLTKGTYDDADQLLTALGLDSDQAYLKCKSGYLTEVYICYSLPSRVAGDQHVIDCPESINISRNQRCDGSITLRSFGGSAAAPSRN